MLLLVALAIVFLVYILLTSPARKAQSGGNATGAPFFNTLDGLFRPKGYRLVKPVAPGTGYGYGEDFDY
jgi:hypothetical protein